LDMPDSSSANLGLGATNVATSADAWNAIDSIDKAIQNLNTQRANIGSTHNRLEYADSNIQETLENHSAARARIGDTDFAEESTNLSRQRFMLQAALKIQQIENSQKGSVLNLIA
jgi:flagellin